MYVRTDSGFISRLSCGRCEKLLSTYIIFCPSDVNINTLFLVFSSFHANESRPWSVEQMCC